MIAARDYESSKVEVGETSNHVSKSDVSYSKIGILYGGKRLLIRVPKCKTMGVQETEQESGYVRRTMPLVFNDPLTVEQSEFIEVFSNIAENVYNELVKRGYHQNRLCKLDYCLWKGKILYAGVVESVYDYESNSRYFIGEQEATRKDVGSNKLYDAVAAVTIDSIYVGSRTVSIQVNLLEVSLSQAVKRERYL